MVIPPNNNIGKSINGAPSSQSETVSKGRDTAHHKGAKTDTLSSTSDEVTLSSKGAQLAKLEAHLQEQSGVDEARVAAARAAIDSGSYKVDSQSLAAKLLDMDSAFS